MTERLTDAQRLELAGWYWAEIDAASCLHPDDPSGGQKVQDLISAALHENLTGLRIDVGDGVKVQFSTLLAPYRARAGGLAETSATARRVGLTAAMQRKRVWW